jgi:hypothetical protein
VDISLTIGDPIRLTAMLAVRTIGGLPYGDLVRHHPPLSQAKVPLGLNDPAKVLAKITHIAELPPLDGGLGTLRFEVMTKEV